MKMLALILALSAVDPAPPVDPRVQTIEHHQDAVTPLRGRLRTALQVVFAEAEVIQQVALGDAVAWEAAPDGNVLFLKPRERHGPTNLIVTTDGPYGRRHYLFELAIAPERDRERTPLQVRFVYPQDEARRHEAAIDQAVEQAQAALVDLTLQGAVFDAPRNLNWTYQGAVALKPLEVFNTARFTLLRFADGQSLPAIFAVTDGGDESLVAYDVRGDLVVVHAAPQALRLRRGDAVLCLWNEATAPLDEPLAGAASPQIVRRMAGDRP